MTKLDVAKEKIAYLKLWLGIGVVTDISVAGWFLTNGRTAPKLMLLSGLLAMIGITSAAFAIHKRIEKKSRRWRIYDHRYFAVSRPAWRRWSFYLYGL